MRVFTRSIATVGLLVALTATCSDREPTMPVDGPLFSHVEVNTTVSEGLECRLTTFEGAIHAQPIHPENGGLIDGSNARFPGSGPPFSGWLPITSGTYSGNPSVPTILLLIGGGTLQRSRT